MAQKTYNKAVNELRLADELVAAIPALLGPVLPDGSHAFQGYDLRVTPTTVTVAWRDSLGVRESQIDAVVLAHDASKKSKSQKRLDDIKQAQTDTKNANPNKSAKLEDIQRLAKALGVDWIW